MRRGARVLDFCSGSGRNAGALRAAGFDVVEISDTGADSAEALSPAIGTFAAVVSTHGLLHGTVATIASRISQIGDRLARGGLLYATFGSVRDARFGSGRRIAAATFAPVDGDERDVAHSYFTRTELESLLRPRYDVEALDENGVDAVAGAWAHRRRALSGAVHWFVIARRH